MSKIFLSDYPHLLSEIDMSKNKDIDPSNITYGSKKKIWWVCEKEHSWQAIIKSRTQLQRGCPYCFGKKKNTVDIEYPEVKKYWNYKKNENLPSYYTSGQNIIIEWICDNFHEWQESIKSFTKKNDHCLICKKQRAKNLDIDVILQQKLEQEWDNSKNLISFNSISKGSSVQYHWKCGKGHTWKSSMNNRVRGRNCPTCSGKITLKLNITHPILINEWDNQKNIKKINEYTSGSSYKAYWKCEKGHSYQEAIKERVLRKGCPICTNRIMIPFFKVREDLIQEWNFTKNSIDPIKLSRMSHYRAWWICNKGHEWNSLISTRVKGSNCPQCCKFGSSKGEKDLSDYISSKINSQIINNSRSVIPPYELDIYIPDMNIAFEFNGDYWHSDEMIQQRSQIWNTAEDYHKNKYMLCKDKEISLYFVWENDWLNNNDEILKSIDKILMNKFLDNNILCKFSVEEVK